MEAMKITFKREAVAASILGVALVGMAGCGGGGGGTRPIPTTSGITVPAPVAGESELLFSATRAADNASRRFGLFAADLGSAKISYLPIAGFQGARDSAWLPGRKELLYVGYAPATTTSGRSAATSPAPPSIRRVSRDGSGDFALPNTQSASGLSVDSDGNRIAYSARFIKVCDFDGGNSRTLREGQDPSWSPDGEQLVFSSSSSDPTAEPRGDIYTMSAEGSGLRRLTTSPDFEREPQFSPDGRRIVFQSIVGTGTSQQVEIFVMNFDGSGRTRLTNDANYDAHPRWTPDGGRIVFVSGPKLFAAGTIQAMNADGSNRVQLRDDEVTDFDLG